MARIWPLAGSRLSPATRPRDGQAPGRGVGHLSAQRRGGYERRQPEQTLLYQVIAEHWSSFRERAEQAGRLPKFVDDEFEAYLRCGILEHGLAHLAYSRCGHSIVVAYSCKRRGFCPSCLGRRMSDIDVPAYAGADTEQRECFEDALLDFLLRRNQALALRQGTGEKEALSRIAGVE